MSTPLFHVVTICNDPAVYAEMRASLSRAGFDAVSRYTMLDNTLENRHDPFQVPTRFGHDGPEPFLMFCHQDLLFDAPATTAEALARVVQALDARDPCWALAGTAGVTARGERVLHLDDPSGSYRASGLPRRVLTLDENFLLFRRPVAIRGSFGIKGFHFYGADFCLHALGQGRTCYAIDFPVTHRSGGTASPAFFAAAAQVARAWNDRFWIGVVDTTCWEFALSRVGWVQRVLARRSVRRVLRWLGLQTIRRRGDEPLTTAFLPGNDHSRLP